LQAVSELTVPYAGHSIAQEIMVVCSDNTTKHNKYTERCYFLTL
jgi:hypothetical protein